MSKIDALVGIESGDKAKNRGKIPEFMDEIVGRLRKFYEDEVLFEQVFVKDGKIRVKYVFAATSKELFTLVKVKGFYKFVLIEKRVFNFAAKNQKREIKFKNL